MRLTWKILNVRPIWLDARRRATSSAINNYWGLPETQIEQGSQKRRFCTFASWNPNLSKRADQTQDLRLRPQNRQIAKWGLWKWHAMQRYYNPFFHRDPPCLLPCPIAKVQTNITLTACPDTLLPAVLPIYFQLWSRIHSPWHRHSSAPIQHSHHFRFIALQFCLTVTSICSKFTPISQPGDLFFAWLCGIKLICVGRTRTNSRLKSNIAAATRIKFV